MIPQYIAVIADWLEAGFPDSIPTRDKAILLAWDLVGSMEKEDYTVASLDQ